MLTERESSSPALREDLWQVWKQRGRKNDRASAKAARVVTGFAVMMLAGTAAVLFMLGKFGA